MSNEKQNKFESLLELLVNEETDKAEQLFHEIVVEKSRDIYEGLADSEATAATPVAQETVTTETKEETKDEAKEDSKTEATEEVVAEKVEDKAEDTKEAVKETDDKPAEEKIKDEGVFTKTAPTQVAPQKSSEETIEEVGGDATDELIKDISADQDGEGDAAADDMATDMDVDSENGENGEEGEVEDRVVDLENALDELKAEFEAMMNDKNGGEAEENALAPVVPAETTAQPLPFEAKDAKETKETVKEYKNPVKGDMSGGDDKSAKSPVASKGGAKGGGTPVKTGSGADDTGRAAPTAGKIAGDFENTGGKAKSTSFKKQEKADSKDGSDKSAKSPVAGK
jgi:hypothetical protein